MKKTGRPSKFKKPVKDRIIKAITAGATYELAADYSGITRSTLWAWLKKGEDPENKQYHTFLNAIKRAEGEGLIHHLGNISLASSQDWKASAWLLERRHGYSKAGFHKKEEAPEVILPTNTLDLLKEQAKDLKRSMNKAEESESWQAYAALQRQFLSVIQQIRQIESEEGIGDELDGITDDQLINEITGAIVSLPPILRQKVEGIIFDMKNVVPIGSKK